MMDKALQLLAALRHPATPWYVKAFALFTAAYIFSPLDLIPDFIPVIGLLDEVILVPLAFALILRLLPEQVKLELETSEVQKPVNKSLIVIGTSLVLMIWVISLIAGAALIL